MAILPQNVWFRPWPPEHRVIVDLEWKTKKPKGWKGGKDAWKQ